MENQRCDFSRRFPNGSAFENQTFRTTNPSLSPVPCANSILDAALRPEVIARGVFPSHDLGRRWGLRRGLAHHGAIPLIINMSLQSPSLVLLFSASLSFSTRPSSSLSLLRHFQLCSKLSLPKHDA